MKGEWAVVYRTGEPDAYEWRRAGPFKTRDGAARVRGRLIHRDGRHALYPQDFDQSVALGLPVGFTYSGGDRAQ